MRSFTLIAAALPILALADDSAPAPATTSAPAIATTSPFVTSNGPSRTWTMAPMPSGCKTADGAAGVSCLLAAEGFTSVAASYLAEKLADPVVSSLMYQAANAPGVRATFEPVAAEIAPTEQRYKELYLALATNLPSGTQRDLITSVIQQAWAYQTGGGAISQAAAPAAVPSAGLGLAAAAMAGVAGVVMVL